MVYRTRGIRYAKNGVPVEDDEEAAFARWLDMNKIVHSHLSNETWTSSSSQKRKMKALGVHSGTPDHYCIIKNKIAKTYQLVFIEMKRTSGGVISDNQFDVIYALNLCDGVSAYVAEGAEEAIRICLAISRDDQKYLQEQQEKFLAKYRKNQEKRLKNQKIF